MAEPTPRPEPEVAIVFTPEPWVGELHRFLADHGGARVREIIMDQRLALEDAYEVLVVSHRWPALTRSFVKQMHEQGRVLLGVYDGDEPTSKVFLANLGADGVVASTASMSEFLQAIGIVAPAARVMDADLAGVVDPGFESTEIVPTVGTIVVVGGPAGSGRTEIACALQNAAYDHGISSILVDADDVSPSVAQRLGLPIEPNLRTAIDATAFGLGDLGATLHTTAIGPVVCGLPNVAAWSQVRATEVIDVLGELARVHQLVIVDLGPHLEDLDTPPRGRNAVTRAVLEVADRIVLVAPSTPRGIARSLNWAADVRTLAPETPMHALLNFAPRDRFRRAECADELSRTVGLSSLHAIPRDGRVDHAHWEGNPVGKSGFTKAVRSAAATILAAPTETEPIVDLVRAEHADSEHAGEMFEATA